MLVQYLCTRYCGFCQVQKRTSGMDDFQESTMDNNSLPHRMEHISEEQPFHINSANDNALQYGTIQQESRAQTKS